MSVFFDAVARLAQTAFRLALFVFASLLVVGVLAIGAATVLVVVIWSLLTGRKPAVLATFSRFRTASQQFRHGRWSGPSRRGHAADGRGEVVDVQAHEVK